MHVQLSRCSVDAMLFHLARVVRYVVEQRQLRFRENIRKDLPHEMREDLAIRKRTVDRGAHCAQIPLTDVGIDRGACKLTIRQADVVDRKSTRLNSSHSQI